jgi:hypothetical protein
MDAVKVIGGETQDDFRFTKDVIKTEHLILIQCDFIILSRPDGRMTSHAGEAWGIDDFAKSYPGF